MFTGFLYRIDLFGVPVSMNFYGKPKSTSTFGGICSLLFFGFIIWAIYNSTKYLFSQTNPRTIRSEFFNDDPPEIILSPETFPLAFQVESSIAGIFINDSIYNLAIFHTFVQKTTHKNGTIEEKQIITNIPTEKCTEKHFGELAPYYSVALSSDSRCIAHDTPELKNIVIQGVYESLASQRLVIQVSQCDNETSLVTCSPKEIFNSYLTGAWFRVIYPNMVINPQNYSDPDSRFQDSYAGVINPANYRQMQIGLGYVEVADDIGWFTEQINIRSFIKVNSLDSTVQPRAQTSKIVLSCTFSGNKLANRYTRTYKKIQDVLAEVGGLVNTGLVLILLVTSPYFRYKYREALINEIFDMNTSARESKRKTNRLDSEPNTNEEIHLNIPRKEQNKDLPKNIKSDDTRHLLESNRYVKSNRSLASLRQQFRSSSFSEISRLKAVNSNSDSLSPSLNQVKNLKNPRFRTYSCSNLQMTGRTDIPYKLMSTAEKSVKINPKVLSEEDIPNLIFSYPQSMSINEGEQTQRQKHLQEKEEYRYNSASEIAVDGQENVFVRTEVNGTSPAYIDLKKETKSDDDNEEGTRNTPINLIKKTINKEDQKFKSDSKTVELTFWEYVCSFIYKTNSLKKKLEIIEEGLKRIDMRLDFINVMKKLEEIDKIRGLLLDHDQKMLYCCLPRSRITERDPFLVEKAYFRKQLLRRSGLLNNSMTNLQALKAYQKIARKKQKTDLDIKLLDFYDNLS